MRILHLAFEDPDKPGAGGGSVRTREVNRRLAARGHDVTAVTYKFPGWRDRDADGVHHRHAGVLAGYTGSVASYFAAIPALVRRVPHDLVVEDFGAPVGSVLVPRYAPGPSVGLVQWLFGRAMARKYHLPVHLVEAAGVRSHRRLIAISDDLAATLRAANPAAEVAVVPEGIEPAAFAAAAAKRDLVVYLGRLDTHQKGVDLLLAAFALAAPDVTANLVVAGDGRDRAALERRAARLGLGDRVAFVGPMRGPAKYDLLAAARVVAMPSRYETFGIVAAEALACGTPVLASDIDCLRAVVPDGTGRRLPVDDAPAWAAALRAALGDPAGCAAMGERGRAFARRFDWDAIADQHERLYEAAVAGLPFVLGGGGHDRAATEG